MNDSIKLPYIFVTGNIKGGAGKTTCAMHLIAAFMDQGFKVASIDTDGFQGLLSMMREGRAWVKFTGPYRISNEVSLPYGDVDGFAHRLIENSPQQIVWGTDWPHVMVKNAMPNDADLCDLLTNWGVTDTLKNLILVENPERLYQFN